MNETGKLFLKQEPVPLKFGTSGMRGLATDLTDLECYLNILGFLDYLKSISADRGRHQSRRGNFFGRRFSAEHAEDYEGHH